MKLRDVTKREISTKVKGLSLTEEGVVEGYKPSFLLGDKVKLKSEYYGISSDLHLIEGKTLTVIECKLSDLNDMLVEVLYIDTSINVQATSTNKSITYVRNPYLAEHFKKAEDEQSGTD